MTIHRYSAGAMSAAPVAAGAAYAEMIAGAARSISVEEIRIVSASNVGGQVALARAFAVGTATAAGVATGVAHAMSASSPSGPSAQLRTAWSSAPTGYVSKLRAEALGVATGTNLSLWRADHDGPLVLEPGASLLVMNQGSGIQGGAMFINVTWSESA